MLIIWGMNLLEQDDAPDVILHPKEVFDGSYMDDWLDEEFARKVISDIQQIDVMDIRYPVRRLLAEYSMFPESLATGTKNVLLMRHIENTALKCRMGMMGENCYKWLMDVADEKEVNAVTTFPFIFTDDDLKGRPVLFADLGCEVTTERQFHRAMYDLITTNRFEE